MRSAINKDNPQQAELRDRTKRKGRRRRFAVEHVYTGNEDEARPAKRQMHHSQDRCFLMKLRLDERFLMQRKMKRSTARERPGNDTLTEPSKRTLLVGVKTVGRGWLATPLMRRYVGNEDILEQ